MGNILAIIGLGIALTVFIIYYRNIIQHIRDE